MGRRRLVTSLSGAAAFHCRLNLGLESGTGAGKPCGVAVLLLVVVVVVGASLGLIPMVVSEAEEVGRERIPDFRKGKEGLF